MVPISILKMTKYPLSYRTFRMCYFHVILRLLSQWGKEISIDRIYHVFESVCSKSGLRISQVKLPFYFKNVEMLNTPSNLPGQEDSSCFCRGGMSKIKYISKFFSRRKTKGSLFFLHLTMLNPANNTTKKVLANLGFRSFNTIKVYVFAMSM